MLRNRVDGLAVLMLVLGVGCSAQTPDSGTSPPKPPYQIPVFDGKARSHVIVMPALQLPPTPNPDELFARVMGCYPAKSFFRAELHAEARAGKVGGGTDGAGPPGAGAGVVLRIPLWSALEIEREREREGARRQKVAASISSLMASLTHWYLAGRQLVLMRGIEKRAQLRVDDGVAMSNEQVAMTEKVVELEHARVLHRANVLQARLELLGLCSSEMAGSLHTYLAKYMPPEKDEEVKP